jgi:hypothetical protein
MRRVGVGRLLSQNLMINALGVSQPAFPVQCQTVLEVNV